MRCSAKVAVLLAALAALLSSPLQSGTPSIDEAVSTQVQTISAPEDSVIRELHSVEYKRINGRERVVDGRVVFSQYDDAEKSNKIVAIDIANRSAHILDKSTESRTFVAEDSRYFVYSYDGRNADPLILFDKRTNTRVAKISLSNKISWGHISGDRLVLVQSSAIHNLKATALVYRIPDLKLERQSEIIGGNDTALWGDKIVSIGRQLGIYDFELREHALIDIPKADEKHKSQCANTPLRIAGDKAVIGASCGRLAVVDLHVGRIERIIPVDSLYQSFAIAEGMLFTVSPSGSGDMRVIELSSGRELARVPVEGNYLAMQGTTLLVKSHKDYSSPTRFTFYEVKFEAIQSEKSNNSRMIDGCGAAARTLALRKDLYAAIEACERAGIRRYLDVADLSPEQREMLVQYGTWLTFSFSRYSEGAKILERIQLAKPSPRIAAQIAMAKRKTTYLDLPLEEAAPSSAPESKGVKRVPIDFGAFPDLIQIEDERVYIGRWDCSDMHTSSGVTLEVYDRITLRHIKRVDVSQCDQEQQDIINALATVPGYIVLGLSYRHEEQGRPTVAVIDSQTLQVVNKSNVQQEIATLRLWEGRLLICASTLDRPHHRFDPTSARYVAATEEEALACANGDPVQIATKSPGAGDSASVETRRYRIVPDGKWPYRSYRISAKEFTGRHANGPVPRQYLSVHAVPNKDALVLYYTLHGVTRFGLYDIEEQEDAVLFELMPFNRPITTTVWERYLLVTLGRDLLVYDIEGRKLVHYEKDIIREGFLNNCCGVDRNKISKVVLDQNRLLILTFDGANSRLIDLTAFAPSLPTRDFFAVLEKRNESVQKRSATP